MTGSSEVGVGGVLAALEELYDTLLFEGYALYPYTPGATKNATPTPFGIVYPPAYAAGSGATFDFLRMHAAALAPGSTRVKAQVRFLQTAPGSRHSAVERRVALVAPVGLSLAELAAAPHEETFSFGGLHARVHLSAQRYSDTVWRVTFSVHNTTEVDAQGLDRPGALRDSLLSTHPALVLSGDGRFLSPLDDHDHDPQAVAALADGSSVNTYPILVGADDDALLGTAIILPDHPELAPESKGSLFDGTEIEEALLLHVLALSDGERAAIADADPAVREMIARAASATPKDIFALHGRTTIREVPPPEQSDADEAGDETLDPIESASSGIPGLGDLPPLGEPGDALPPPRDLSYMTTNALPPVLYGPADNGLEPPTFGMDALNLTRNTRPKARAPWDEAAAPDQPQGPAATGEPTSRDWGGFEDAGEDEVTVDGVTYRLGAKVILRLSDRPDPYDRMMDGRMATVHRIFLDYENKLYFGVTIDDDAAADLLRDTNRFLFFFLGELELCE